MAVLTEPTIIRDDDASDDVILAALFNEALATNTFVCSRWNDDVPFWVARPNWFAFGDSTNFTDKKLVALTGADDEPFIRYRVAEGAWELSDDGVSVNQLGRTRTPVFAGVSLMSNSATTIDIRAYGTSVSPTASFRRARGTMASPSAVQSGDELLSVVAMGYHSGGAFSNAVAAMKAVAAQNFTSSAQGTYLAFETTPTGSTTRTERMRIGADGVVTIYTQLLLQRDGAGFYTYQRSYSDTLGGVYLFDRARGSLASPSVVQSGDFLGGFQFRGWDGSSWGIGAFIYGYAVETFSTTAHGGRLTFWTTPSGSTSYVERLRIDHDGVVYIYSTASPCLSLSGGLKIGTLTGALFASSGTVSALAATAGSQYLRRNAGNTAYEWATLAASDLPNHASRHVVGGADPITGNLDANARVGVRVNSAGSTYTRRRINFIAGASITISHADDSVDEEVDVTVNTIQAITTTSSPTFAGVTLTSLTGVLFGNGSSAVTALAATAGSQYLRRNAGNTAYEWATLAASDLPNHASRHVVGGADPITGNLDANARVGVRVNSAGSTYTRRRINFIAGASMTISHADDSVDEEVDVTVNTIQAITTTSSPTFASVNAINTDVSTYILSRACGTYAPRLILDRSRGTSGSPTAVQSGDPLGELQYRGYDGSSYSLSSYMQAVATENWTTSARGSYIRFYTTPTGSTTATERMRIGADGVVTIYTQLLLQRDGAGFYTYQRSYASADFSVFYFDRARGSVASPAAVQSGDILGGHQFRGWDGSSWGLGAFIYGYAAETFSTTGHGAYISFFTVPTGSTSYIERMRITASGSVEVYHALASVVEGTGGAGLWSTVYATSSSAAGSCTLSHARGTRSSPSALVASDTLGKLAFMGHTGSAWVETAAITAIAAQNFGSSAGGTDLSFFTTANGTTSYTRRARITSEGVLTIDASMQSTTVLNVGGESLFNKPSTFWGTSSKAPIVFGGEYSSNPTTVALSLWYLSRHLMFGKGAAALQAPGVFTKKMNNTSTSTTVSYFIDTTIPAGTLAYPGMIIVRARGRVVASASVTPLITFTLVVGSSSVTFSATTAAMSSSQWVWWELVWYVFTDGGTNAWKAHALLHVGGIVGGTTGYSNIDAANSRVAYHTLTADPSTALTFKVGMNTSSALATIHNDMAITTII